MAKLYIFTGVYPYTQNVECFLEDEIKRLSRCFEDIVVVPTRGDDFKRLVPSNCFVTQPIFPPPLFFLLKGLYHKRSFKTTWRDFLDNRVYTSIKKLKVWCRGVLVTNNLLHSPIIKDIEKNLSEDDVCYYYWGKWSNVLSIYWGGKCKHVSRFHGAWDLWEEDYCDYAPFRKKLSQSLDAAVFISRKGLEYFASKYPKCRTVFSSLGSEDFGVTEKLQTETISLVSCSSVYPLKRVELIYATVHQYAAMHPDKNIRWTHIGGGESFMSLKSEVGTNTLNNLVVNLSGSKSHDDVIGIYSNEHFDVFINLSTNEGVPVSIMEALSFDIPAVATNVGATDEVVREGSGFLVSPNPTIDEVVSAIDNILTKDFKARDFWNRNYNAEKNYMSFAHFLMSLSTGTNKEQL